MRALGWFCVVFAIGIGVACSGGKTGPAPVIASSTTTSSSASTTAAPAVDDAKAICARVCAVQTKCGGDAQSCGMRCAPIARVLLPEVVVKMVQCAENNAPTGCADDDIDKRKHLIGRCVVEATQQHEQESKDTIALFAKAYCDRNASCGTVGPASPNECMGEARGALMSTEGESSGGLYGSLRPSKVDEIVACLGGPCDQRKPQADLDVERCLDNVLAKAAEQP